MIEIRNVLHDLTSKLSHGTRANGPTGTALDSRPHVYRSNGRAAIADIFNKIGLKPSDEVYITNSSKQTYISACVTCSVFNYCKPSRVLSKRTKAIFVIHEYGVPHPDLLDLVAWGKENNAVVIEDCAHTMDSTIDGKPVGSFGDYVIYSLPKLFPQTTGGILVGQKDEFKALQPDCSEIEKQFKKYMPYLAWLSQERHKTYNYLKSSFPQFKTLFEVTPEITPFFIGFWVNNAVQIRISNPNIDWGTSMDDRLLLIPTNPLIERQKIEKAVREALNKTLGGPCVG